MCFLATRSISVLCGFLGVSIHLLSRRRPQWTGKVRERMLTPLAAKWIHEGGKEKQKKQKQQPRELLEWPAAAPVQIPAWKKKQQLHTAQLIRRQLERVRKTRQQHIKPGVGVSQQTGKNTKVIPCNVMQVQRNQQFPYESITFSPKPE